MITPLCAELTLPLYRDLPGEEADPVRGPRSTPLRLDPLQPRALQRQSLNTDLASEIPAPDDE